MQLNKVMLKGVKNKINTLLTSIVPSIFRRNGNRLSNFDYAQLAYAVGDYKTAFNKFIFLAEQGHAEAQYKIGKMYVDGKDVLKNYKEAAKWYKKAANQGVAEAQYELGRLYDHGEGTLGVMDDNGKGVLGYEWGIKWYVEAPKWYRKAAINGNPDAQYKLGLMYTYGDLGEKDSKKAYKCFKKAADQGHANAMFYQGLIAEELIRMTEKLSGEDLRVMRGDVYRETGADFLYKDKNIVADCFKKAAKLGDAEAQNTLGFAYSLGSKGLEQNFEEATKWYRKAAENGNYQAQLTMGEWYAHGNGDVLKNYNKARYWINKYYENPDATSRDNAKDIWEKFELWKY